MSVIVPRIILLLTLIVKLTKSSSLPANETLEIAEIIDQEQQYHDDMDMYQTYYSHLRLTSNNNFSNSNNYNINNHSTFMILDYDQNNKDNNKLQYLLVKLYNDIKFWRNLFIIVGAVITICGCTLNTLCIFIFYKSNLFHNSSFPYYVYVLSIVDSLCLIIRYVVPQASENLISSILLNRYNATNDAQYEVFTDHVVSEYHCNIIMYIHNTLGFASTWIMAAISIERWLVIKYPLQTKSMIKLRAFLILSIIIVVVFLINIFDFAPNFYNKPHWFSNLTLLCEPYDSIQYIGLGKLKLNADAYSFVRILLQAVGPFVVALLFNSLIIHNFKRIKSAAYKIKSTSSVSVMVSPSHSSHCCNNAANGTANNNSSRQPSPVFKQHKKHKTATANHCAFSDQNLQLDENHLHSTRPSQASLTSPSVLCKDEQQQQQYGLTLMPPDSTSNLNNNTISTTTGRDHVNHSTMKYSFKRRLSKLRLHRETDVMLIVLSFSILITQLPCTIVWYLIYYQFLLTRVNMYLAARSPILIYILRLIEMLYFSMNFIFYITLSPSLRKELKLNPLKHIRKFFSKRGKASSNRNQEHNRIKKIILYNKKQPSTLTAASAGNGESKFNLLNTFLSLFRKNNKRNSKIYKIKSKVKEQQQFDIKIIIDNYENNNEKLLNGEMVDDNCDKHENEEEDIQMRIKESNLMEDDEAENNN